MAQVGVLLLAGAFAIPAGAGGPQGGTETPAHPEHAMGTRLRTKGLRNFGEVTPNLYRGGQPTGAGIEALQKMGVEIVVDLRGGRNQNEEAEVTRLGMKYVSIPWHCPFPKDEPFARFLKVIQENPGKKVFVHCRLGDDRTGMEVASYRMADEGWSAEEAMTEMRAFGFTAVHHVMCPGLADYEAEFPERLKKDAVFRELGPQVESDKSK